MSWSISRNGYGATPVIVDALPEAIDMAVGEEKENAPQLFTEDVMEQVEAAKQAAISLANSGAVGGQEVTFGLAGHSNPQHEKRDGYSNDTITVTVSQA